MKVSLVIIACLLSIGLSACNSSNDTQKKSVFDGYVKDVNKAKQVQVKVDAAKKKLDAQLKKAESAAERH